ncbi:MAG: response regulator [Candidatus Cloacimonetes bacterium]|nr:response regulator [Candidatus Cloacimonadota bacterium]
MSVILVVDDKPDNLVTIKALLNHLKPDCEVITALSGQEGIELAHKYKPDTIILDIFMPGMDGYETCKSLKSDPVTANIPILMLTAIKTDTQSRIKGLENGADAFFTKPIDPYELGAQVDVLLRIKQTEDRLRNDKLLLLESVDEKTRALLANEIKLNQIIEGFSIPAFVIDKQHKITHWNQALEKLTALPAAVMKGSSDHWKVMHKEARPLLADLVLDEADEATITKYNIHNWQRSTLQKDALESEKVFLDRYFLERWYYCTAVPFKDENGNITCALQTIQDITKRKETEIELNKHRQKLEELVKERTQQLLDKNEELERMNRLFSGREFRIKELRDRVKELENKIR